jgi:hypothetical protein
MKGRGKATRSAVQCLCSLHVQEARGAMRARGGSRAMRKE